MSLSSIDNLITDEEPEEGSALDNFSRKQKEIKVREIEREAEGRARLLGLPYINLDSFPISGDALGLIEEMKARDLNLVCFFYDGKDFRLGTTNPTTEVKEFAEELQKKLYANGVLFFISENSLRHALELYKNLPKVTPYTGTVEISPQKLVEFQEDLADYRKLNERINEVNISDVITLILAAAIRSGSSDIHIEAEARGSIIRLRIDGVLHEAAIITGEKWRRIATRLKILAKAKINITNQPQDGRFSVHFDDRKLDVRCSFLPTAFGESVVLRLLDSSAQSLSFERLGLRTEVLKTLKAQIKKPNGMILTAGPTGSGKTTTLYAILNELNKPNIKIITLENPIEYQLPGINQSQISEDKGYTFAEALRSVLRQDPNILMVGEIRDSETAKIALQSSITGHLVLSTIHTNDAAGVIPRLLDLEVEPYLLPPALNAVIGQRLVRRLCPHCRESHELSNLEKEQVNKIIGVISPKSGISVPDQLPLLWKAGKGCPECSYTGYHGRIGIYELFTMDEKIKQLTIDRAPSFKILQQAIENGMITMLQDGILKCFEGITSIEEVYRVVGDFDYINEIYDIVISQTIGRGLIIKEADLAQAKETPIDVKALSEQVKVISPREIVNLIMSLAIVKDAGDVHIEPTDNLVKVRFRIDGVLHDIVNLPKTSYLPVLAEMKILAGFETNVKRATLDGRFSLHLPQQKMDCRISIISGGYGETIVIRLLSAAAVDLDLEQLGVSGPSFDYLTKAMSKTKGIIITTGPTGSGKTTTLYAILNKLNRPDIKIITVEDPIEYQLPGTIQTQIDAERGYTFVSAMRSLLRQNPNIMMIGEIRDAETAKIAIEAASTGHLVLSTIHANSAAGAISRFSGLGVERQALANTLEFSIGQRLVRRLCKYCRQPAHIDEETLSRVRSILLQIKNPKIKIPQDLIFYTAPGCPHCNHIGYKGRVGIYETITTTPTIMKLIQDNLITDYEIEQAAIAEGMVPIVVDGILKALAGETSLDEIFRVI